ncbi:MULTISPECIES: hypothetical protein [unclassified Microbacterium]|uniref:hypothetical protein n=1 Tax=unclassified Microbacterium TaxID=2609290 RepID=UPI003C2E2971
MKFARWNGDLSKRRVRVVDGDLSFDCYGTPSRTPRLHVFLSAGGGKLKDGVNPTFPRSSWHPWVDGVSVNIDDPTFAAYPGRLQTGWYLGTKERDAIEPLIDIVARIQLSYGIADHDVIFVGSSAGGTAALKLAAALPGSTAIAENPPIYPHLQSSIKYFRRVGFELDSAEMKQRNALDGLFDHSQSRFFIFQNLDDTSVMPQLDDLMAQRGLVVPGVGVHTIGSATLTMTSAPTLSPHHVFLNEDEFRAVLRSVDRSVAASERAAVLQVVSDCLRNRALMSDRLSNLKGWGRLLAELDAPELDLSIQPVEEEVLRIRLRSHPEVQYRMRLGFAAKQVFMAVDVKRSTSSASPDLIQRTADAVGARAAVGRDGSTLSIARVPMDDAARRLRDFVRATVTLFS